jgi:hypothetical protein
LYYVTEHLRDEFPKLLSYNRFIELERKVMVSMALFLKLVCFGQCSGITFVDSTKIAVCHNKRIKRNMKNKLMPLYDKIMLRKRSVIETINDELKNICQIEHSRHRSPINFLMNLFAALGAYSFLDKKPAIKFEQVIDRQQLLLFY